VVFCSIPLRLVSANWEYEGVYRLQQKSSGQFLDAFEGVKYEGRSPYAAVTRTLQNAPVRDLLDKTQTWMLTRASSLPASYTLMHYTSGRFLTATEQGSNEWQSNWTCTTAFASTSEYDQSQIWHIQIVNGTASRPDVRIVQASSQRALSASLVFMEDYQAKTEPVLAGDEHQMWTLVRMSDRPIPLHDGVYTIYQKSTDRQLDAYTEKSKDTLCVTRNTDFSTDQHYIVRRVRGEVYTLTQKSSGLTVGAHPAPPDHSLNYTVVTRDFQGDDSQEWLFIRQSYDEFVLIHVPSGRIMDAYESNVSSRDYRVFTTAPSLGSWDGNITSQVWRFMKIGIMPTIDGMYRLMQKSSARFLDSSISSSQNGPVKDLVTSPRQESSSQTWEIQGLGQNTIEVKHQGSGSYLTIVPALTSGQQSNYSMALADYTPGWNQMWFPIWIDSFSYNIRHLRTGMYLDAYQDNAHGWRSMLRPWSGEDSQVWILTKQAPRCVQKLSCPIVFECGQYPDTCGGTSICGPQGQNGICAQVNEISGVAHSCTADFRCECVPRSECTKPGTCGSEDDGCGGRVMCGSAGICSQQNPVTGELYRCNVDDNQVRTSAIQGVDWKNGTCECVPKPQCSMGMDDECRIENDGCGGQLRCGACPSPGLAPAPAPASLYASPFAAPFPGPCAARSVCDVGMECGYQPDGCGGFISCGGIRTL